MMTEFQAVGLISVGTEWMANIGVWQEMESKSPVQARSGCDLANCRGAGVTEFGVD